jgi:transcriptional regulator with XRE-family HTH domain
MDQSHTDVSAGEQLRAWRKRRRLSQLDLALDVPMSTRHLSFIETGRSQPSRTMLLGLAEALKIPPRDQNLLLAAAGFAPARPERPLSDPAMADAKAAVELVLRAYEPFPALAVDRHWSLVAANGGVDPLLEGVAQPLLDPPTNVLRLSLHPDGLAPRIRNLPEWRAHLFRRLEEQIDVSGDRTLASLLGELRTYPGGVSHAANRLGSVAIPLVLRAGQEELSFLSTTTIFGTPVDVVLAELAIEAFLPADARTAELLISGAWKN